MALAGRVLNAGIDDHPRGEAGEGGKDRRNIYLSEKAITETSKLAIAAPWFNDEVRGMPLVAEITSQNSRERDDHVESWYPSG